jgi:anti-sigma regulatory factor (Ser/Thr protein kinase)
MWSATTASSFGQTMSDSLEVELPRYRGASRVARQVLAERFGTSLTAGELDIVRLLVSELVDNAVLHGQGRISLKAQVDARHVRVDVVDDGTGFERQVRHTGFDSLGGRGLQIVEAESSRWGISEGTTHVWFELERHGPRLGPS